MRRSFLCIVSLWTALVALLLVISKGSCWAWTTAARTSTRRPLGSLMCPRLGEGKDELSHQRHCSSLLFSSSSNNNNYKSRRAKAAAAANRRRQERAAQRRAQGKNAGTTTTTTTTREERRVTTKESTRSMLKFIETQQVSTVRASESDPARPEDETSAPLVRTIVRSADLRKAQDCVALRVSKVTALCTFVVLVSGNSRPQNQAIAAAIMDNVEEEFDGLLTKNNGVPEGTAASGWILLDYGDVMVHIMTPKSRLFYDLEGQWREKGGEYMDISDVLVPNVPAASIMTMMGGDDDDDDNDDDGFSSSLGTEGMANIPKDDPFWS